MTHSMSSVRGIGLDVPLEQSIVTVSQSPQPRLASGACLQLSVGLMAGVLIWGVHPPETRLVYFPREARMTPEQLLRPNPVIRRNLRIYDYLNCAATVGLMGILTCGAFGLAEGWSRRSWHAALLGLLAGVLLGGMVGALAGLAGRYTWASMVGQFEDIQRGMLLQSMMWGCLGMAAGVCMALPTRKARVILRCAVAAATGGLISAMLFGVLAAQFFPCDSLDRLIPEGYSRVLWTLLTTSLMGVVGGWYGGQQKSRSNAG